MSFVVSLCDRTGNMVRPWVEAGFTAVTVDLQTAPREPGRFHVAADVRALTDDFAKQFSPVAVFAFPPCTSLSVSGARWFKDKGLSALVDALGLVEKCRSICEASGGRWMLENPVSTLSTYWRKPDFKFHPSYFTGFESDDNYTKLTCLWTGGGFVMPDKFQDESLGSPDDRIHRAPPSDGRGDFRSETPVGFARAVFAANAQSTSPKGASL